ncbi:MAG: hypothetical protein L0221_16245 [Chloroflexi bacterium]|nr:hypothetical protein [Chloroflexota bacterium]
MRRTPYSMLFLGSAVFAAAAFADDLPTRAERTLRESRPCAPTAASPCRVVVDTLWGGILVRGHDASAVEMIARETIRAATDERAAAARSEVRLEITAEPGLVDIFVDGPFRDREDRRRWASQGKNLDYEVVYDFELLVPARADLELRTVLGGDVRVAGVRGEFDLANVVGNLALLDGAGHGSLKTVSGNLEASFVAPPDGPTSFETVSGNLDVRYPRGLAADGRFTTSWGELWSEFEFETLPVRPAAVRRADGRWRIDAHVGPSVRIGGGGPLLTFETLSGTVRLRKSD